MLWVVGELRGVSEDLEMVAWNLCGVFDDQGVAEAHCVNPRMFVGPVVLNQELPDDVEWPGCYYPNEDSED